jgi:hypothetical protein
MNSIRLSVVALQNVAIVYPSDTLTEQNLAENNTTTTNQPLADSTNPVIIEEDFEEALAALLAARKPRETENKPLGGLPQPE